MFSKTTEKIESFIGENSVFRGNISAKGTIRIDGTLEGDAEADWVIVGDKGLAKGNISARGMIIGGRAEGNLTAGESVEIRQKGVVTGDINTLRLSVLEGGVLNGRMTMQPRDEKIVELHKDRANPG
jgi:cytoskeletal protein CcmA (bactofilin family)